MARARTRESGGMYRSANGLERTATKKTCSHFENLVGGKSAERPKLSDPAHGTQRWQPRRSRRVRRSFVPHAKSPAHSEQVLAVPSMQSCPVADVVSRQDYRST